MGLSGQKSNNQPSSPTTTPSVPIQPANPAPPNPTASITVTPGTVEAGGKVIQVDPWSQGNYEGLPKADLILLTDIHGDHMDPKEIDQLKKDGTTIIASASAAEGG